MALSHPENTEKNALILLILRWSTFRNTDCRFS